MSWGDFESRGFSETADAEVFSLLTDFATASSDAPGQRVPRKLKKANPALMLLGSSGERLYLGGVPGSHSAQNKAKAHLVSIRTTQLDPPFADLYLDSLEDPLVSAKWPTFVVAELKAGVTSHRALIVEERPRELAALTSTLEKADTEPVASPTSPTESVQSTVARVAGDFKAEKGKRGFFSMGKRRRASDIFTWLGSSRSVTRLSRSGSGSSSVLQAVPAVTATQAAPADVNELGQLLPGPGHEPQSRSDLPHAESHLPQVSQRPPLPIIIKTSPMSPPRYHPARPLTPENEETSAPDVSTTPTRQASPPAKDSTPASSPSGSQTGRSSRVPVPALAEEDDVFSAALTAASPGDSMVAGNEKVAPTDRSAEANEDSATAEEPNVVQEEQPSALAQLRATIAERALRASDYFSEQQLDATSVAPAAWNAPMNAAQPNADNLPPALLESHALGKDMAQKESAASMQETPSRESAESGSTPIGTGNALTTVEDTLKGNSPLRQTAPGRQAISPEMPAEEARLSASESESRDTASLDTAAGEASRPSAAVVPARPVHDSDHDGAASDRTVEASLPPTDSNVVEGEVSDGAATTLAPPPDASAHVVAGLSVPSQTVADDPIPDHTSDVSAATAAKEISQPPPSIHEVAQSEPVATLPTARPAENAALEQQLGATVERAADARVQTSMSSGFDEQNSQNAAAAQALPATPAKASHSPMFALTPPAGTPAPDFSASASSVDSPTSTSPASPPFDKSNFGKTFNRVSPSLKARLAGPFSSSREKLPLERKLSKDESAGLPPVPVEPQAQGPPSPSRKLLQGAKKMLGRKKSSLKAHDPPERFGDASAVMATQQNPVATRIHDAIVPSSAGRVEGTEQQFSTTAQQQLPNPETHNPSNATAAESALQSVGAEVAAVPVADNSDKDRSHSQEEFNRITPGETYSASAVRGNAS